jgi:dTDP-4-amino-4,6-dideoxygalactose transaminase/predicted dehydrogenase
MHATAYEESSLASLVAVADVNPLSLGRALDRWPFIRAYVDLDSMLREQKPDIVSICTWPQTHDELVAHIAASGVKGIICEKPLALTLSGTERMLSSCRTHGVKLAGVHQYRFHPRFIAAAQMALSGELGEFRTVSGCIASTIANNGPHLIDTIRFILGNRKALSASCTCTRSRSEWNRGYPAEDAAVGKIVFDGNVECQIETGDRARDFFSISVEGTRGSLEVTLDRLVVNGKLVSDAPVETDEWLKPQFGQFIEWVKGHRQSYPADADSSAETVRVMLALYESARLGSAVSLPFTNDGDVIRQLYPEQDPTPVQASPQAAKRPRNTPDGPRLASEGGARTVTSWFSEKPDVGLSELSGLTQVILSKNMNSNGGTMVRSFEKEFARAYGSPVAVASTSGTAAIHVAVGALNLEPCDEIITTPITDMGSVIPILAANCIPVFADVDPVTGNMTAQTIEAKLTPRTRAVILVHLFGRPAELGPIVDLARNRGIFLIEDCAQAHYAEYEGRKVGSFGDLGCFSLQQSKQITCGDGGITLVNGPELADRAAMFVDKGWDRKHGLRTHLFLGMNYRMTELQGAVARAQLQKLPRLMQLRRQRAEELTERLQRIPHVIPPPKQAHGTKCSWWTYPFSIESGTSGIDIDMFHRELTAEGVRVSREYVPQAVFNYLVLREQKTYGESRYPFSEVQYIQPKIEDFPGFMEFKKSLLFTSWSHNVTPKHVLEISGAIEKLIGIMAGRS